MADRRVHAPAPGGPSSTQDGRAERRSLRILGAAALLVGAGVHLYELGETDPVFTVLFVLSAAGMLAGTVALLTAAPRLGWVVGGGTALLTLVGFVLDRTTGLPVIDPSGGIGNWGEVSGLLSMVAEAVAVAAAVAALTDRHGATPPA